MGEPEKAPGSSTGGIGGSGTGRTGRAMSEPVRALWPTRH